MQLMYRSGEWPAYPVGAAIRDPPSANDQTLRSAAQKTTEDEGYEADLASINIRR